MTTDLVLDALEHASFTRAQEGNTDLRGLIAHSDAGSQDTSVAFTQRLINERPRGTSRWPSISLPCLKVLDALPTADAGDVGQLAASG